MKALVSTWRPITIRWDKVKVSFTFFLLFSFLTTLQIFDTRRYDVVVMGAEKSRELDGMHTAIAALPNVFKKQRPFEPHCTIAYTQLEFSAKVKKLTSAPKPRGGGGKAKGKGGKGAGGDAISGNGGAGGGAQSLALDSCVITEAEFVWRDGHTTTLVLGSDNRAK